MAVNAAKNVADLYVDSFCCFFWRKAGGYIASSWNRWIRYDFKDGGIFPTHNFIRSWYDDNGDSVQLKS
jgi:hypothetical protein